MSSNHSNESRFLIGGRYRNRLREYEVTDIVGTQLSVVYDDGTWDTLDANTQDRIIRNMAVETAVLEPYQGIGNLDRNRQYFQSIGFLASRITMMEAIVPPKSQAGFVQSYREITGNAPQEGAIGYYVHHQQVDKWGNELRVTFNASETELQDLDFGPGVEAVVNPGSISTSWRINRNVFWWNLLRLGFRMGNQQVSGEIRERVPQVYRGDFDGGLKVAL